MHSSHIRRKDKVFKKNTNRHGGALAKRTGNCVRADASRRGGRLAGAGFQEDKAGDWPKKEE